MRLCHQRALPQDPAEREAQLRRTIKNGNMPGPDARGELARCIAARRAKEVARVA